MAHGPHYTTANAGDVTARREYAQVKRKDIVCRALNESVWRLCLHSFLYLSVHLAARARGTRITRAWPILAPSFTALRPSRIASTRQSANWCRHSTYGQACLTASSILTQTAIPNRSWLQTGASRRGHLTYTFKLRHGVRWANGQPFTAADVVFTNQQFPSTAGIMSHRWIRPTNTRLSFIASSSMPRFWPMWANREIMPDTTSNTHRRFEGQKISTTIPLTACRSAPGRSKCSI